MNYDLLLYVYFTDPLPFIFFFFFNDTATTEIYTLSLHDALPIRNGSTCETWFVTRIAAPCFRSEEHTSELQSRGHLVCRLLLEKKKQKQNTVFLPKKKKNKKKNKNTNEHT